MAIPRLILFDEPSLGLSPIMAKEMFKIISDLHQQGTTILLVEQNVVASLELADYAYVLENGSVVLSGSGKELLKDDRVRQAYLGI
jgi:branched-chain amino acid transport system ATP-binding protein